jgi:DNA polymerase (family 10)
MPVHNSDVTEVLGTMADLLEINGANEFRVRAYRDASRTIDSLPRSLAEMVDEDEDLSRLPGIGESLAGKIEEILETGKLKQLEKLKKQVPGELSDLLMLPGLGPKRVKQLHYELGIEDHEGLAAAARQHKIRQLKGLGPKTEQNILDELQKQGEEKKRWRLAEVEEVAEALLAYLRGIQGVKQAVIAGSYRRRKATVGDLDILVTCKRGSRVVDRFTQYDDIDEVLAKGKTRSSVRLRKGLQVDLRVVAQVSHGAALHYFTGSRAHNIAVRKMGVDNKLKINEYGVFRGDDRLAGRTEEEVYGQVDLPYIAPEMREARGELDAAQGGELPSLITRDDIRGDLHCHTKASDGKYALAEMAEAAKARGYEYLAITEHSKRLTVARGLDEKRLRDQMDEIDQLNEQLSGIRLLKGIECDILEDGSLDLADEVLAELDVVVCAIHSKLELPADKQTERVMRAMDNPHFHILAHPTGRMIGRRGPYELDVERTFEAARERGCYLEVNAQPERLDLNDTHCKLAKDMGLKLVISTDSHATTSLEYIRYGIDQARRGWLEPEDVINTRSWDELNELLVRS